MHWTRYREMSAQEYCFRIKLLGLSIAASGRLLGVSNRTARRYAHGNATIPPAHVLLIRAFFVTRLKTSLYVPPWKKGDH
jgi:transcriptional regulator with XRE-family HTH domain